MVAVISGSGLGLFGSTVSGLGGIGGSGNAVGRGNDRVYVNTSTGNLIVQSQDEHLSALGLDLNLVRTYNSQGLLNDDNADNWRLNIHQRVSPPTGTRNTAGSTITKVFGDGREVRYTYDEERSAYVSTEGDGAHDTLQYDEPAGEWTWTDGSERNTETYDSDGRLRMSRDRVGTSMTYEYSGSLLRRITDASGQVTHLDYNDTDLMAIRVVSNNQTQTLTRYFYDSAHRLRQVVVDLTPSDNSAPLPDANGDGLYEAVPNQTYVTAYTYDGTSRRIASITQADGSSIAFTYEQVGTTYRVKTHTDAEGRTTTYSDVPVTGTWSGPIVQTSPAVRVGVPKIAYDAAGNGIAVWDSGANVFAQRYIRASDTWGPVTLLAGPSGDYAEPVEAPSLSLDSGGNALVAWTTRNQGPSVARFDAASGTWSAPELIAADYSEGDLAIAAIHGGNTAVLWTSGKGYELRISRWTGSSWITDVLDGGTGFLNYTSSPKVSVDRSGNITVVTFTPGGVYTHRFSAATGSWSGSTLLASGNSWFADVQFDANGNGFALRNENGEVTVRRYTAATNSWSDALVFSVQAPQYADPALSVDASGNAVVAWSEYEENTYRYTLKARNYNPSTATWGPEAVLGNPGGSGLTISMNGASAVIGWIRYGLFVSRFDGTNWSAADQVDTDSGQVVDPSLTMDANGNVAAIWRQQNWNGMDAVLVNRFVGALGTWTGAAAHITPAAESVDPQVVYDASGNAFAGWIGREQGDWGSGSVYVRRYDRASNTWSSLQDLTRAWPESDWGQNVTAFTLATDSQGNAIAVWEQRNRGGGTALYASRYLGVWTEPTLLASSETEGGGRIVARINGDQTAIAWLQNPSGWNPGDLVVIRRTASGWNEAEVVETYNGNLLSQPTLGMDAAGNINVAWRQPGGLYTNRFAIATNAWAGPSLLEATATNHQMAFSPDGNGTLVWSDGTNLYTRRFLQATNTWTAASVFPKRPYERAEAPSLVVDAQGNAVVSWTSLENSERRAYVARFDASSGSWSAPINVGGTVQVQWQSAGSTVAAVNGAHAVVGWMHTTEAGNQFYVSRFNNGTWSAPELLETFTGAVRQPSIAIDASGYVNVLWRQSDGQVESIYSQQYALDALRVTNVTDALGRTTTYTVDRSGRLSSVLAPAVDGVRLETRYTYDAAGNLISIIEDPTGLNRVTTYAYDENGNLTRTVDALGNTVTRTYDGSNQLRIETTYVAPDPDGAGSAQPSIPLTTRYTYDSNDRLRFIISAEGRVTEHRYEPAGQGQRTSTLTYTGALHTGGTSLNSLIAWASAQDLTKLERTDFAYDFRGNLASTTTYDATTGGNGTAFVTRFVYDQRGQLLQTIDARGSANANPLTPNLPYATTYTYDGLGRVLSTTQWQSDTRLVTTSLYSYDDANRVTRTTLANGLVTTNTYNRAGELISTANGTAAAPASLGTTTYKYDAAGKLRIVTDPLGVRQFHLYDAAGRKIGEIDGDGTLRELVYNRIGQVVKTVIYAQRLDSATLGTLINSSGNPLEVPFGTLRAAADDNSAHDRIERTIYDDAGRVIFTIDAIGAVTRFVYDGAGRLLEQVRHANTVTIARSVDELLARNLTVTPSADDRLTRYFYDADGKLLATLDPMGYLVENTYGPGGRLTRQIKYATPTNPNVRPVGTLDQLRPARDDEKEVTPAQDIVSYFFYDGQGRKVGELDGESYFTETVYDAAGNISQVVRYDRVLSYTAGASTFATLKSAAAGAATRVQSYQYDGANRVTREVDHAGTITTYTYDVVGNRVGVTRALDTTEVRTTEARYDFLGRVIQELTAEGRARITAATSQDDIELIWNTYGVKYAYDLAGRKISATVRPDDSQTNVTRYFYDNDGRLRFEINQLGERIEYRYNALNQLTDEIRYTIRIPTTGLNGGLLTELLIGTLTGSVDAAKDARTTYEYSLTGKVSSVRIAKSQNADEDGLTTYVYNAFGEQKYKLERIDATRTLQHEYVYDKRGQLATTFWDNVAGGFNTSESRTYDAFGRLRTLTDARNITSSYEYDRLGREVATVDGLNGRRVTTYDAFSRTLTTRDALNNTTIYAHDDSTRTTTVTTPEGVVITTVLNRHGQTLSITAGRNTTSYHYDANGQVTRVSDLLGTLEERTYDRGGRQITQTDAVSTLTRFKYDAANRVFTRTVDDVTAGLRLVTTYEYDGQGRVLNVTDPDGRLTRTTYERDSRAVMVAIDPNGLNLRTAYTYDRVDRVLTVTEGYGSSHPQVVKLRYDVLGRRTHEIKDPGTGTNPSTESPYLNLTTEYRYDAAGNLTRKIDGLGHSTWYVYDADNRLTHTINALGEVVAQTYDAEGRVVGTRAYTTRIGTAGFGDVVTAVSVTANDGVDRTSQTLYDRDGRARFSIDATYAVTERTFDANGDITRTRTYQFAVAPRHYTSVAAVTAALEAAGNGMSSVGADDRLSWNTYDLRGRAEFTIDAQGAVVSYAYDAAGNVTAKTAFATERATSDAMDGANLRAWAQTTTVANHPDNRTTRFWYDRAGREVFSLDAEGYLTETRYDDGARRSSTILYAAKPTIAADADTAAVRGNSVVAGFNAAVDKATTSVRDAAGRVVRIFDALTEGAQTLYEEYIYDAVGHRVATVDARGREIADTNSTWAQTERTTRGFPAQLSSLTASQRADLRNFYTTRYKFDAAGREIKVTDPVGNVTSKTYDAVGNLVHLEDARGNDGYFFYDAAGRVRYQVDPSNYVTEKRYDALGNVTDEFSYADPLQFNISPATTMAQVAGGVRLDVTHDRHVSKTYDTAGRVHVTTYHGTTTYTDTTLYNTFGEKRQFTDKNQATYNYYYTRRGELEREVLPASDVVTALEPTVQFTRLRLEHRYEYNAFGQLSVKREAANTSQVRVTRYFYDQRGAEERTELPAFEVFDSNTGMVSTRTPTVQKSYDAAGNLVLEIAANGGRTVHYYDSRNLRMASVDADNVLREFEYDAVGNRTAERTYDTRLTGVPQPGTRPAALNATEYRELRHRYDARNLRVATYTRAERLFSEQLRPYTEYQDGYYTAEVTTFAEYDANGNLVRTIDGNNVANVLAKIPPKSTFQYYDASGNRILQVDPAGYVVRWEYNAQGQIERETKYTGQLDPTFRDRLTARFLVEEILAAVIAVSSADDNRITEYDYDNHGRIWRERKVGVSYASVNSTTGALSETSGDIDTVYEYDGNGNITAQINPGAHGRIDREYDALGREQTVRDPQFLAFNGWGQPLFTTRSVLVRQYDAHGNVVAETRSAVGTSDYRQQRFAFDVAGNLRSSIDASGARTSFDYDITGNTARTTRTVRDINRLTHEYRTLFHHDILGREISRQDLDDEGTSFAVTHETRDTRYNAHGDIEAKGINKQWQEKYRYDLLGRLIYTNKENGTPRLYVYDANGNAVIEIHAIDTNLANVTHPSQVSPLSAQFTVNRYDLRNQLTEVIQPPMTYGALLANQPIEHIDPPEPLTDYLGDLAGYTPPRLNMNQPVLSGRTQHDTLVSGPHTSTVTYYGVVPDPSSQTATEAYNVNAGTFGLTVPPPVIVPDSTRVISDDTVETADGFKRTLIRELTRSRTDVIIEQLSSTIVRRTTRTVTERIEQTSIYTRVRTPVGSETSEGENWTLTTEHDTDTQRVIREHYEDYSQYTNSNTAYRYTGSSTTSGAATVNLVRPGNAGVSWYRPGQPPMDGSIVSYGVPDLSGLGDGPTIVEVIANGVTHTASGYGAFNGRFQAGGQLSSVSMRITRNGVVLLQTTLTNGGSAAVSGAAVLKGQDPAATSGRFRLLDANGNPITNWDATPLVVERDSGREFVFREPSAGAYPAGIQYEYEAYAGSELLQRVRGTLGSSDHRREYVGTTTRTTYNHYEAQNSSQDGAHNGPPIPSDPQQSNYLRSILSSISQRPNEEHIIRRRQEYNAFGEVTAQIDGNTNRTDLYYNELGRLVRQEQPEVSVHPEQGAAFITRPTSRNYYDELGQLVGTQDANSSLLPLGQRFYNTRVLVNGRVTKEFDAVGAQTSYAYDGFGDMRQRTDALGRVRTYAYDENGRLELAIVYNELGGEYSRDTYEYDAAGNRISHTNALNLTETYLYDSQNRIQEHTSFGRKVTRYSYVYSSAIGGIGGFEKTTFTEAATGEDTLVDRIDYFGKTRWHRDMGGHEFTYLYNYAGWLKQQTGTTADSNQNRRAQNIVYEYYHNGYLKSVTDSGIDSVAQFQYDKNGNRTFESYSQTPVGAGTSEVHPYQVATAQYDALNRVTSVVEAGKFNIRYTYDAVGNRRSMHSTYFDLLANSQQEQLFFYTYDQMNRFTVTMGQRDTVDRDGDGNTQEIVRGTTGYEIEYDLLGRREHVRSELLSKSTGLPDYVHEYYTYDPIDTVRESFVYKLVDGAERLVASTWRDNDRIGNLKNYYEYSYDEYGIHSVTKSESKQYDDDGRLRFDENNFDVNRRELTEYQYVGNGILDKVITKTVDALGNQVSNVGVATLAYTYEKWDSYKERFVTIRNELGSRPDWQPGQSIYKYNANGHIVQLVDSQDNNRTIDYVNNHLGQVLKRYEIDPSTNARTPDVRRFYFLNGRPIGDVGTEDAPSRVDYAQQLASQEKEGRNIHPAIGDRVLPVTSADFDQNYRPINDDYPPGTPGSHVVQSGETLQSIARSVWGDASLWYLIAEANGLSTDDELVAGLRLTIPNVVTNIHNNADTFRPYDPALALGDTTPTLPSPPAPVARPKKGCGVLGMVLVIIVAIVVTIYTAGVAATAFSGGAAVSGSAVVAGTAGLGTGTMMAAAAIGGAVGAAASQGVAIAMGMQEGFDWKGVALGAIGAGVGAGLGAAASSISPLGTALSNMNPYVLASLNGAASSALTQGIAVATGLQSSFNWRNVAISAVAAPVAKSFGTVATELGGNQFASRFASGIGGSLVRRAFGSREDSASIIADAFGNAVGDSIVDVATRRRLPPDVKKLGKAGAAGYERAKAKGLTEEQAIEAARKFALQHAYLDTAAQGRLELSEQDLLELTTIAADRADFADRHRGEVTVGEVSHPSEPLEDILDEDWLNVTDVESETDTEVKFTDVLLERSAKLTGQWNGLVDNSVQYWIDADIPVISPLMGTLAMTAGEDGVFNLMESVDEVLNSAISADRAWQAAAALMAMDSPDMHNKGVQKLAGLAVKHSVKSALLAPSVLLRRFKKLPGVEEAVRKATSSNVAEYAAAGVLASIGLFDEAHMMQNRSGHGLDFIGKSRKGEWIPIEIKTSQSDRIRLRGKQRDGADDYTKHQLRLIKGGGGTFTTSRLWTADLPALAGRIEDEQRAFRTDQGEPYRYKGYVLGIQHLGQRKMSAGFVPWLPK